MAGCGGHQPLTVSVDFPLTHQPCFKCSLATHSSRSCEGPCREHFRHHRKFCWSPSVWTIWQHQRFIKILGCSAVCFFSVPALSFVPIQVFLSSPRTIWASPFSLLMLRAFWIYIQFWPNAPTHLIVSFTAPVRSFVLTSSGPLVTSWPLEPPAKARCHSLHLVWPWRRDQRSLHPDRPFQPLFWYRLSATI